MGEEEKQGYKLHLFIWWDAFQLPDVALCKDFPG
jgi:hypothetical protein